MTPGELLERLRGRGVLLQPRPKRVQRIFGEVPWAGSGPCHIPPESVHYLFSASPCTEQPDLDTSEQPRPASSVQQFFVLPDDNFMVGPLRSQSDQGTAVSSCIFARLDYRRDR